MSIGTYKKNSSTETMQNYVPQARTVSADLARAVETRFCKSKNEAEKVLTIGKNKTVIRSLKIN